MLALSGQCLVSLQQRPWIVTRVANVCGVGVVICDTEYIFRAGIVCTCTKQILYLIDAVEVSGLQMKIQQTVQQNWSVVEKLTEMRSQWTHPLCTE